MKILATSCDTVTVQLTKEEISLLRNVDFMENFSPTSNVRQKARDLTNDIELLYHQEYEELNERHRLRT